MDKICGIYKIVSPNGKVYIGQSVHILHRFSKYRGNDYNKKKYKISRSISKYGWKSHIFEIIEQCEKCKLDEREIYWIKFYNSFENGLNLTTGGFSNNKVSLETRIKMSNAKINKPPRNKEYRENCGKVNRGRKRSQETKDKLSKAGKGRAPWNKGIKGKQIAWNKGKSHSEETKKKISNTKNARKN